MIASTDPHTFGRAIGSLFDVANGPFPPGSIGYLDDTGYPTYDPEGAKQIVDEWEQENGPLRISYKTTSDEFNLISGELFAQLWEEAGNEVTIDTIDQTDLNKKRDKAKSPARNSRTESCSPIKKKTKDPNYPKKNPRHKPRKQKSWLPSWPKRRPKKKNRWPL